MIDLKQWMEACEYKITEGSRFCWDCFGHYAYTLDSWDGKHEDGHTLTITFDTETQVVYKVEAYDYANDRAYRIINPDYAKAHKDECTARNVDDEAYEGVTYTDLELDEDWLEKATAIAKGKEYDTGILIPLDLPDHQMLALFKMAHDAKMTFNDYVQQVLRDQLEIMKKEHGL